MMLAQRLRRFIRRLRAARVFRRAFRHKRVCLVGNAAALQHQELGPIIDGFDIVVRFNVATVTERERSVGSRTDIRFIGLTLREKWQPFFADLPTHDVLWTFEKNSAYLHTVQRAHVAIPTELQGLALPLFTRRFPTVYPAPLPAKPPRTGLVFLLLLLMYGRPREVVLYGFSQDEREAYEASYRVSHTRSTDADSHAYAHCDPRVEIAVMNRLSEHRMITLG